jgi:hypothetical protein
MNEVTHVLSAIGQGDPKVSEQRLPLVYDEPRKLATRRLAHEKPGQTLQVTALVHEVNLRLVGTGQAQRWQSPGHFFAARRTLCGAFCRVGTAQAAAQARWRTLPRA